MKVDGKKAIVTGAAKGMGAAITTTLAREGADVLLTARDTEPLEQVADEVQSLYCSGPAAGGGVRQSVTSQVSTASVLVPRAPVEARAIVREVPACAS